MQILTVCLGNICRSPAAAAVLRSEAARVGIDVDVDSAGTGAYHLGEPPHPRSIEAGKRRGYEVTGTARRLIPGDFHRFDLIVTMDAANLAEVRRIAPTTGTARIAALRSFDPQAGADLEIPDPWGQDDAAYDRMFDLIVPAVQGLLVTIR